MALEEALEEVEEVQVEPQGAAPLVEAAQKVLPLWVFLWEGKELLVEHWA